MKDYLHQLLDRSDLSPLRRTCVVREYLQARILQCLQEAGAFTQWAFLGGTALRFLYALPRYSEDLDFSLIRPGASCSLREASEKIARAFEAEGYEVRLKVSERKVVAAAQIGFPGLLFELGLSGHQAQALWVRIEVDTNPPAGARLDTTLIRRHVTLRLLHYDRASLLAGKLHALLARPWLKGRDLYDLIWYLSDPSWPEPNIELLNAALQQTNWPGRRLTAKNWRAALRRRLREADIAHARNDVIPFLEREQDADLITRDNIERLLKPR